MKNIDDSELVYLLAYLREHKMTYVEYLQTEHWQETKRIRLSLPFCYCSVCGFSKYLNVHHKTYRRIGREEMDDLEILCWKHHKSLHELVSEGVGFDTALASLIHQAREDRLYQTKKKNIRKKVAGIRNGKKKRRIKKVLEKELMVDYEHRRRY